MRLFKAGRFIEDTWQQLDDTATFPAAGRAIVTLARWQRDRTDLTALNVPVGVRIEPAEPLDFAPRDIASLALIGLTFPKFSDGRSYSKARVLREQLAFTGELRATGDVLLDQIPLMRRCGFDAFEIASEPTIRAIERQGLPQAAPAYQRPAAGARLRNPAEAAKPENGL